MTMMTTTTRGRRDPRHPNQKQSQRADCGVLNDLPIRMAGIPALVSIPFPRNRLLVLDLPTSTPGEIALTIGDLATFTNTCISVLTGITSKDTTRTALHLPGIHLLAPLRRPISGLSLMRMEKPSLRIDNVFIAFPGSGLTIIPVFYIGLKRPRVVAMET